MSHEAHVPRTKHCGTFDVRRLPISGPKILETMIRLFTGNSTLPESSRDEDPSERLNHDGP